MTTFEIIKGARYETKSDVELDRHFWPHLTRLDWTVHNGLVNVAFLVDSEPWADNVHVRVKEAENAAS